MESKKCHRCKKCIEIIQFKEGDRVYENCKECRMKIRLYKEKNIGTVTKKEYNADYKAKNKELTKKMNLFYRMTKDMSPEEKKILKEKFQKEHNIKRK